MAEYNEWMNSRLYKTCSSLSDAEIKAERGAFFKSIYLTLNHIMYGDLAFMSRFTGDPSVAPDINQELYSGFSSLYHHRVELDKRIITWTSTLTEEWLSEVLTYQSKVDGKHRAVPHWVLVVHMFNHQTHHRGQVTTLLSQMGLDLGTTDIPFMPLFQTS